MDDTCLGLIVVCLAEAASNITRLEQESLNFVSLQRSMRSSLNYEQSKQVAEWNRTSERQAFSEKDKEDALKPLAYLDIMEDYVVLIPTLVASVNHTLSLCPTGRFSSRIDGAHLAEGPTLPVTYLRCSMAIMDFITCALISYIVHFLINRLWSPEVIVRWGLAILGTLVSVGTYEAGQSAILGGLHTERFIVALLCFNSMALAAYPIILMLLNGLTAAFAIWSCRSVMSSLEFSALVVVILLCNGRKFVTFLCKTVENWDHNIREPLPKWLNEMFELPDDEEHQLGLSPPGALWQENKADHVVGNLVLNDNHLRGYMAFSSLAIAIVLLMNRMLFARRILSNTFSACVLDMIVLTGAFGAVTSRRAAASICVFILVIAVLVYIALQVLVRVGSGSLSERYVLRRNRGGRRKYPLNFVTPDHLLELMVVNAAGNCSESADPAVDDEHDANRPIKRSPREATWRVACAAPHHMTGNRSLLLTGGYMPVLDSNDGEVVLVNLADNKQAVPLRVRGSGSVRTESIALDNVWYVPGLDSNLVSTGQLVRQGCAVNLGPGGCRITSGDALVGTARFTEACQFELDFLKVAASSM